MKKNHSNKDWLRRHLTDPYVQQSQQDGYASRAVYKLKELDEKRGLLKTGMCVVDLGAAPGGWSQYAKERVGEQGVVIALDLLPLKITSDVHFIQGDFTEDAILTELLGVQAGRPVDVVLSDMAPNFTGNKDVDVLKTIALVELAADFALQQLKPGGTLVAKVFHGSGLEEMVAALKPQFQTLRWHKPKASRSESRENYLVATR